ncbi:hypothetical protein ACG873_01805 (plasmid) [Mesorhizobium sp. AaZ16]|uniref:hypothetical protein n=1 Tax=Mesorhizobium sp. AaZ16 TaxID=3402289 RepID=UPI00374F1A5A
MTTIRDMPPAPLIEGERRNAGSDGGGMRIVTFLAVSAVVITLMNLAAAIYLYRASGQVRLVQRQLDELSSFEKRLIGRLDLVNTGLQGQFDKLNSVLPGRLGEIHDGLGRLTTRLDAENSAGERVISLEDAGPAIDLPPAEPEIEIEAAAEPDLAEMPPPRKRTTRKSAPTVSPAYQRVETPDGKVLYRKIQ